MYKLTAALLTLSFSISANAALLVRDWQYVGDGSITYDSTTGLDWLDLPITSNLTYNYVSAQLSESGAYSGWQYATLGETHTFLGHLGLPITRLILYPGLSTDVYRTMIQDAASYVGNVFPDDPELLYGFEGIVGTKLENGKYEKLAVRSSTKGAVVMYTNNGHQVDADFSSWSGHFLVRVQTVPLPASIYMFGSALIGLICFRKKSA